MHWRVFTFCVLLAVAGPPLAAELGPTIAQYQRAPAQPKRTHRAPAAERELLHFWRPNCPVSVKTQVRVRALRQRGYGIRSINTLQDRTLSRNYAIDATPTFIVLEDGRPAFRYEGGLDADEIARLLRD